MKKPRPVEPIDLSTWELGDEGADRILKAALKGAALEGARQVLQIAADAKADLDFPWEWGTGDGRKGPRPEHPMIAYISMPFGPDEYEHASWAVDLRDVVNTMIEYHESGGGKVVDADSRKILGEIADGFRELASMLDEANRPDVSANQEPLPPASEPPALDDGTPHR